MVGVMSGDHELGIAGRGTATRSELFATCMSVKIPEIAEVGHGLRRSGVAQCPASSQAGVDPTLEGRALQDALRAAIATRRGYCSWDVDHAGWVVTLHSPDEQDFYGKTLEEALAWCLVWLMAPELGIGPFLV
jgi:hypothetical protein